MIPLIFTSNPPYSVPAHEYCSFATGITKLTVGCLGHSGQGRGTRYALPCLVDCYHPELVLVPFLEARYPTGGIGNPLHRCPAVAVGILSLHNVPCDG